MSEGSDGEDVPIEEEIDGDLEILHSPDMRYVELRLWSNQEIGPEGLMAVLEAICMRYGGCPERLFQAFAKQLPQAGEMT